jgi:hypothetical protein
MPSLTVIAYCHPPDFILSEAADTFTIQSAQRALATGNCNCELPIGCRGALIRVGDSQSRMFLIVLSKATSDDEKRALAHELEHVRDLILQGARKISPPRSSF